MDKPKYNLSDEGFEKLTDRLIEIAQEEADEAVENLMGAKVTTKFVETMTKVKGVEDVIERNEQLSKTYQGYLSMYGFESMYDLYMYAMACDFIEEVLTKGKDYSKLVPVKRKIMRNGKETEVTVYTDPNKGESEDNNNSSSGSTGKGRKGAKEKGSSAQHARDLTATIVSDKESANPKTIAKLKEKAKSLPDGNKGFSDTSDFYLTLKDAEGNVNGIIGYSLDGEFLVMDFYRTDGEVPGQAARGFIELVNLARQKGKGVKAEDYPQARIVYAKCGLSEKDGNWQATYQELQEAYGESGGDRA